MLDPTRVVELYERAMSLADIVDGCPKAVTVECNDALNDLFLYFNENLDLPFREQDTKVTRVLFSNPEYYFDPKKLSEPMDMLKATEMIAKDSDCAAAVFVTRVMCAYSRLMLNPHNVPEWLHFTHTTGPVFMDQAPVHTY